jgi:hypothetical protein
MFGSIIPDEGNSNEEIRNGKELLYIFKIKMLV